MSIKISGTDAIDDNRKGLFQSANVGTFNPGNRPGSASTGDLIYNTSTAQLEVWNGSAWVRACGADAATILTSGGNDTGINPGSTEYVIFTSPGTFVLDSPALVGYMIVAGGGSSGVGGGGAGGLIESQTTLSAGSYPIVIGAGGAGNPSPTIRGTSGNDTTAFSLTAIGGGAGGCISPGSGPLTSPAPTTPRFGLPGGSGGGGGYTPTQVTPRVGVGGDGTPGQGFPGQDSPGSTGGNGGGYSSAGGPSVPVTSQAYITDNTYFYFPPSYGDPIYSTPEGRAFSRGGFGTNVGSTKYNSTANTGRGADDTNRSGGSGIVIIVYNKYQ
jgi:hypothetical protein